LRGGGKIVGLPRAVGAVSDASLKLVTESGSIIDRHDNVLGEKLRRAVDEQERAEIASWDRNQRYAISSVLADAALKVAADKQATAARRAVILSPPPVAANDFTTALRENEIRQSMRTLTADQQSRVMKQLGRGETPDVLLALARDPAPLSPLGEGARALYRGFQTKAAAEELAQLDAQDEGHEWAETSLTALKKLVE
jgi:hypothetical protein